MKKDRSVGKGFVGDIDARRAMVDGGMAKNEAGFGNGVRLVV